VCDEWWITSDGLIHKCSMGGLHHEPPKCGDCQASRPESNAGLLNFGSYYKDWERLTRERN